MQNNIERMVKLVELENQYGSLSCFDYEKEYNQMDDLSNAIIDDLEKEHTSYGASKVYNMLRQVVKEHGEVENYTLYEFDDFLEYCLEYMQYTENEKDIFSSVFYYMDSDSRIAYVKSNFILDMENNESFIEYNDIYHDDMLHYIMIVEK